jgi:signal transduction histidine kinase
VNPAFEGLTGLKREELIGRSVRSVMPGIESFWIETYGRVVLTGEPEHFENYAAPLDRWFEVFAFRTEPGLFAVVFREISERRQVVEKLEAARLAALNVMEDAVEARHEAEMVSRELDQARKRLQQAHDELESRVQERTVSLKETVQALQEEIARREELEETIRTSEQRVRFFAAQCLSAQEAERKRIAGELHDSLASTLVAVKYRLEVAVAQMAAGSDPRVSLQEVVATMGGLNKEIRRIMADLRPAVLDDLGLLPALSWYCREFEKTYSHIKAEKQIEISEDELAEALKTPIFRLAQEALNNVAKHSGASRVTLRLAQVDSRIVLDIRDNGRGFDLREVVKGLGLATMKERTEFSGGDYRLESAPGKGTALSASWPLED